MQLSNHDLFIYGLSAVVMPLLLVANLSSLVMRDRVGRLMWAQHPTLMRVSLVIIGLLAFWSWVSLAAHFGLIPPAVVDVALAAIGLPFVAAAVAEIWLAVSALRQFLSSRAART
jgi:phosphoglycerol transferase MdoB-like AlkP superfamily enzyme